MRSRWTVAVATGLATIGCTDLALAAVPAKTSSAAPAETPVASTGVGTAPRVLVDSHGTVNVVYVAAAPDGHAVAGYARKAAGSSSFTKVSLPGQSPSIPNLPLIYEPSPGVLQIIDDVTGQVYAWRSADDGRSWTQMDTSALNALKANGIYISSQKMIAAPGGPIVYAGNDQDPSGQVIQIKNDLSGVTTLATNTSGLGAIQLAQTSGGTLFMLGANPTGSGPLPFQVGSATGTIAFPACADNTLQDTASITTVGANAVVGAAGCGKVWTHTITPDGTVGPLVTVGVGAGETGSTGGLSEPALALASANGSNLTAAFRSPGGDVSVAHSTDGSRWTIAPGALPVATAAGNAQGLGGALSSGTPTWYASTQAGAGSTYAVRAGALSTTYRAPKTPSGAGISHPRHVTLGSLSVTVPGAVPRAGFDRTGRLTVRIAAAIADHLTVSVTTTRDGNYICTGTSRLAVTPGKVRTLTLLCHSGGVVVGGVAAGGVAARHGDLISFTFTGRNGDLNAASKVN